MPGNITADATGPSGAAVAFAVTVTDPDDAGRPAAACTIPSGATATSGAVFPVGTTKVTCAASDSDDANSPVSGSFTVTVVVPALRFDAHAYGVKASAGPYTVGPTASADLTCTTTAGSVTGSAPHTATTATSTLSSGRAGITASGSIATTATAAPRPAAPLSPPPGR